MALVRMTEKKIAASRANAKESKGPTTAAGKQKVSRNACKHHIYARKFLLPPAWEARIWDAVNPCVATVEDPVERACLTEYFVLKQWALELFAYEIRLLEQSITRLRSFNRGVHAFTLKSSFFHALALRSQSLDQKAERARRAWVRATRKTSTKGTVLHFIENTLVTPAPKTRIMAAAAGASTSAAPTAPPTPITRYFHTRNPKCRIPSPPIPTCSGRLLSSGTFPMPNRDLGTTQEGMSRAAT